MLAWLKQLYGKLPLIRESVQLQQSVNLLSKIVDKTEKENHRALCEIYMKMLVNGDRYSDPKRLARFEHQVYSQNGEDGILNEIFRRINVLDRRFLEIGVGDGLENNTAFLLTQGWRGVWVEGDQRSVQKIRSQLPKAISSSTLELIELFVTRENIADALLKTSLNNEFDLLSLDIDRNTYWIWTALAHLKPRVVVVEYNATFPPTVDWKVPYESTKGWDWTINFGASLKAFELLGRQLGYLLVGCDTSGTNAFFVRKDCCEEKFLAPFEAEFHYEPPRYWLVRTSGHSRSYPEFL